MKQFSKAILAFTLLFVFYGCSSFPMLDQLVTRPNLEVTSFSMSDASLFKQTFKVRLKVDNPNAFSLPVLGLEYGLNIAGVDVAQGINDNRVTIPAGGSDELNLKFNTNLLKSLPDLKNVIMSGGKDMSYKITGNVKTDNTFVTSIPFTKSGQFELAF